VGISMAIGVAAKAALAAGGKRRGGKRNGANQWRRA
jgi:hypothetical protein